MTNGPKLSPLASLGDALALVGGIIALEDSIFGEQQRGAIERAIKLARDLRDALLRYAGAARVVEVCDEEGDLDLVALHNDVVKLTVDVRKRMQAQPNKVMRSVYDLMFRALPSLPAVLTAPDCMRVATKLHGQAIEHERAYLAAQRRIESRRGAVPGKSPSAARETLLQIAEATSSDTLAAKLGALLGYSIDARGDEDGRDEGVKRAAKSFASERNRRNKRTR